MFGYFLRYFFARASYDLVRADAQRRIARAKAARLADILDPKRKSRSRAFKAILAAIVIVGIYSIKSDPQKTETDPARTTVQHVLPVDSARPPLASPAYSPVPVRAALPVTSNPTAAPSPTKRRPHRS